MVENVKKMFGLNRAGERGELAQVGKHNDHITAPGGFAPLVPASQRQS